jgi:hypothetical protein
MCFRSLSCDPFTDIGRAIPEFRSVGLPESKEFDGFSVDKKNVFEIDGQAARFLFQYAPKRVDMFSCNAAAYKQHHEVVSANYSVDSAAHVFAFGSILVLRHPNGVALWVTPLSEHRASGHVAIELIVCKTPAIPKSMKMNDDGNGLRSRLP